MKAKPLTLALLAAGLCALAPGACAQSAQDIEELRSEIRALRIELEQLKRAQPAPAPAPQSGWNERLEAVELKQKDAVVLGDIPGGLRLPGSETSIRLYGQAEANLLKDFRASAPGDTFSNLMEQPLGRSSPGRTALTAQTSRFGIESATPTARGSLNTKLEADFYAYCGASACNRNRLRLRHAYGEYAGWLAGQTWSTFMDVDNLPETVDFNGPPGATSRRPVQLRYSHNRPGSAKFQFALEEPGDGVRLPNLVARVDKAFDWGSLNARLLTHEQRAEALSKRGLGLAFGAAYKLSASATLMAQYTRVDGDGDGAYLVGANYPAVDKARGLLRLDRAQGLVLGLSNTFSEQLRASAALGLVRSLYRIGDAYVDAYGASGNRQLYQWHAGLYYLPIKNVELGSELLGGRRTTFGGEKGDLLRLNLQARYLFN